MTDTIGFHVDIGCVAGRAVSCAVMDVSPLAASPLLSRIEAVRVAVVSGVVALAALGLLLLARRAAGAIAAELDPWRLVATLTLAAAVVFGGRLLWQRSGAASGRRGDQMLALGGSAALVLACLGCALPSWQSWAWLLWLPLVGADVVSRRSFLNRGADLISGELESAEIPPLAPPFEGGGFVSQRIERLRDDEGVESIRGTLRAEFLAGQRHATLHVGFCPPLERLPEIEAEVVDGPDATVKIVQAFAHGARLEVRLDEPAEEACAATVEFVAVPNAPLPRRG